MDNSNISQTEYQTLGKKVFWLFFLQIAPAAFFLLFVSVILLIFSSQPIITDNSIGNMQNYLLMGALVCFLLFLLVAAISFGVAWLTYINYTFFMAEDSFKIRRGILSKTENAIPYRQVQNVDIERGLLFQLLGLSRVIILTAGHEDIKPNEGDEAEGVIPAVDKKLAEWLQTELLKRADIQKTVAVDNK